MLTAQQRGSIISSAPSTMNIGGINNNNLINLVFITNKEQQQNNLTLLRFSDNIPSTIYSSKDSLNDDTDSIAHL